MERETVKKLLPIFQAYAYGRVIEICDTEGNWREISDPSFDSPAAAYRVKSETIITYAAITKSGYIGPSMYIRQTAEQMARRSHSSHILRIEFYSEDNIRTTVEKI